MAIMQTLTDQMGRQVEVPTKPIRIVSLVPSQTELLYDLGLTNEVVGQTLFCIHPTEMHQLNKRVGGTKNFNIEKIKVLNPDLIIGNKEENDKERIEELAKHFPVWMSDIQNLDEALDMIAKVGSLVNKETKAQEIVTNIKQGFDTLNGLQTNVKPKALYLIWKNPWMAAGANTFIDNMLNRMGMSNIASHENSRYPELDDVKIKTLNPTVVLLSSEPYPFKEKHIEELRCLFPQAHIQLVDGELFSWYGSRLQHSAKYFEQLLQTIHLHT